MKSRMKPGMKIMVDRTADVARGIQLLVGTRVLVGVPSYSATRADDSPLNNAEIAYINDNGAPEAHIPARPFMIPGVQANDERIQKRLVRAGKAAFAGDKNVVERQFAAIGMETASSMQAVITNKIPPPLADSTLAARIARRPGGRLAERRELVRRGMGKAPSMDLVTPLIDTGALRRAITYAIRKAPATP